MRHCVTSVTSGKTLYLAEGSKKHSNTLDTRLGLTRRQKGNYVARKSALQAHKLVAWQKGQSGNPGGRPRIGEDIASLARTHTAMALQTLVEIASGRKNPPAARAAAAQAILDRGFGKPSQTIHANVSILDSLPDAERSGVIAALQALAANEGDDASGVDGEGSLH